MNLVYHNQGENHHNFGENEVTPIGIYAPKFDQDNRYGYTYQNFESELKTSTVKINDYRCYYYDDNRQDLYQVSWVHDTDLHGLDPHLYICESYFFDRVFIADPKIDFSGWDHTQIMNLLRLKRYDTGYALDMVELLAYTGKSQFKNSLRNQLIGWMIQEDHKYNQPLSYNQYSALTKFANR